MKKLLPFLFVANSIFAANSAFALSCDMSNAAKNYTNWDLKAREVVTVIGFSTSTAYWASKEGVRRVGGQLVPIYEAVGELQSLCEIATERDEALRYFKAWSYLLKKGGPISSYFATQVDIGSKILEAAKAIGASKGLVNLKGGLAAVELKLRGENCNKGIFVDTDCDWSNNDFDKVIGGVDLITSSGDVVVGRVSFCRENAVNTPCFSSEPYAFERYYKFDELDYEDSAQDIAFIRVTLKSGDKNDGRIYIPAKAGYAEINARIVSIPIYINDERQVRYNY